MPTYQYACTACGEQLEVVQSFTDPALTDCPACGAALRKVFSAVGVVFKGSGFYKTDSRKSTGAPAGTAVKADGATGADGKSSDRAGEGGKAKAADKAASSPSQAPAGSTA